MDATLQKYRDIFDKKTFCYVATVGQDGTAQVTPVWCEFDGTHVVFNTARGRVKDANLARNGGNRNPLSHHIFADRRTLLGAELDDGRLRERLSRSEQRHDGNRNQQTSLHWCSSIWGVTI